jgi:hypothetical protein
MESNFRKDKEIKFGMDNKNGCQTGRTAPLIRAAIFGTSRSGKDYTINDAQELLRDKGMDFKHVSPIHLVHQELKGQRLRDMTADDKSRLVEKVRSMIEEQTRGASAFIDEHYSFPEKCGGVVIDNGYYGEKLPYYREPGDEGRLYEVVFCDEWIKQYDLAVYMEIDPDVILERFRTSEGDKYNPFITAEDVRLWQLFELERIQYICNLYKVPLFYIYDHTKSGDEMAMIIFHYLKIRDKMEQQNDIPETLCGD